MKIIKVRKENSLNDLIGLSYRECMSELNDRGLPNNYSQLDFHVNNQPYPNSDRNSTIYINSNGNNVIDIILDIYFK